MRRPGIAIRALGYGTGFVVLWGWLAVSVRAFDPGIGIVLPSWLSVPGQVLCALGLFLSLICAVYFVARGGGTPAPFDPPTRFVAAGPYRFVRNPMYLGGFVALAGAALWLQSVAVLLLASAFLFLFHLFVVFYEEPALEARFGQSYRDYRQTVNRWIPGFPARRRERHTSGGSAT